MTCATGGWGGGWGGGVGVGGWRAAIRWQMCFRRWSPSRELRPAELRHFVCTVCGTLWSMQAAPAHPFAVHARHDGVSCTAAGARIEATQMSACPGLGVQLSQQALRGRSGAAHNSRHALTAAGKASAKRRENLGPGPPPTCKDDGLSIAWSAIPMQHRAAWEVPAQPHQGAPASMGAGEAVGNLIGRAAFNRLAQPFITSPYSRPSGHAQQCLHCALSQVPLRSEILNAQTSSRAAGAPTPAPAVAHRRSTAGCGLRDK